MLPQIWITRSWNIRVSHHQCEEGPEVAPLDLNTRLGDDCRREELVSVEDLLVGVVGDHHLNRGVEMVQHLTNHFPHNERLQHP